MHFVHVIDTLRCGGVQTLVLALCRSLIEQEHVRCSLLVMRHAASHEEEAVLLPSGEVDVHFLSRTSLPAPLWVRHARLKRMLKKIAPDIVHCHAPMPHTYAALAAQSLGLPVVATIHNTTLWPRHAARWKAMVALRLLVDRATDRYIAICEEAKANFVALVPRSRDRFDVIHNMVDAGRFCGTGTSTQQHDVRTKLGIRESAFVFVNVATMDVARKNQIALVEGFSALLNHRPDTHLLLLGDGADAKAVRARVQELNTSANIHFLGFRRDVENILREADCFVLPSLVEGVPIALLEAMSLKMPVLVSPVGGMGRIVRDGVNGFITPPVPASALGESMLRVRNMTPPALAQAGNAALSTIEQDYSPQVSASRHVSCYGRVLAESATRTRLR